MKKLLALILCLALVLSMAACGAKEETPGEEDTPAVSEPETSTPESSEDESTETERPTLTIGIRQSPNVEDYETNDFTKYLEDGVNVNLDFVYFSGTDINDASTQLALMMSGGETLPDILWGFDDLGLTTIFEYGEDGYLVDLTDYFNEEYTPNLMEQIELFVPERDQGKIFQNGVDPSNGAIYGFPFYVDPGPDGCATHVEVNTAFLEALGMEAPTTVDELYDYLKAVVENDPNGNGVADEIGAIGYSGYCANLVQFIINAYVYCNDKYFFNATDGEIWVPYNTDEYRQALIYVKKLVDEGLLSTMTFTIPNDQNSEVIPYVTPSNQTAITGLVGGHLMLVTETDNPVALDYDPIVPLKAATDKGGYAVFNDCTLTYGTMITTDCQNVELAVKLLDFMQLPESVMRLRYGALGDTWEYTDEGTNAYGQPATVKVLKDTWSDQDNKNWHGTSGIITGNNFLQYNMDGGWMSTRDSKVWNMVNIYNQAPTPDEVVGTLLYNAEENEVVSEISKVLTDYVKEARALFATGAMDPNNDADWQSYLDALEGQGLSRYIEAAQSAYTRMTAN